MNFIKRILSRSPIKSRLDICFLLCMDEVKKNKKILRYIQIRMKIGNIKS